MSTTTTAETCQHCNRPIIDDGGVWVDPDATGDDAVWRETCDASETFTADHVPASGRRDLTAEPEAVHPAPETSRVVVGTSVRATPGQVAMALGAPIDGDRHRGEWRWFRIADGSLIFGFFPYESVYEQAVNGPEPIGI